MIREEGVSSKVIPANSSSIIKGISNAKYAYKLARIIGVAILTLLL